MAIITDTFEDGLYWIQVGCSGSASQYYEKLGYIIPKRIDNYGKLTIPKGSNVLVRVEHLPEGSNIKVTKVCDMLECNKITSNQKYCDIIKLRKLGDGLDRCKECGYKKAKELTKIPEFEKSLAYRYPDIAKEWHSILNGELTPDKVYGNSGLVFWWKCPKCQSDYDMNANTRVNGNNCPYCHGSRVNHTNCLKTKNPEIANLLSNSEDGYRYTFGSRQKVEFICPRCNNIIKNKKIRDISYGGLSCPRCSDGVSYPEKFIYNFLYQWGIDFEPQKRFYWAKSKRYDFYIPEYNIIIEAHGGQHYDNNFQTINSKSLKEIQDNDFLKERLAINNGICKYIIIDCAISDLNYIKNSILESELKKIREVININWLECHKYACCSLIKIASDLWNSGIRNTLLIGKEMKLTSATIRKYLKQAVKLNWCDYDTKESSRLNSVLIGKMNVKPIVQIDVDTGEYVNEFPSVNDASRKLSIGASGISQALNGKVKTYKGSKWVYKEKQLQQLKGGVKDGNKQCSETGS